MIFLFLIFFNGLYAKEIAFSFDDAPLKSSQFFETLHRTETLIEKLKTLNSPAAMIFANPCKKSNQQEVLSQLKKYKDAGHIIANHTCSHLRLDDTSPAEYTNDILKADKILQPLLVGTKFFRFPYLNEGKDIKLRDQIRDWLKKNNFKNGSVSIDTDDYVFSFEMNKAKKNGNKIDFKKVEKLFVDHLLEMVKFYDELAVKNLGYSPKHVILLHEMDVTVMFIDSFTQALRKKGWNIISASEAYTDKLYEELPLNINSGNGIISQINFDKKGLKKGHHFFDFKRELRKALGSK